MNEPRIPLVLSVEDKRSRLWLRLVEQWEYRLTLLQRQNEGDKTESETANLRGRIAEVRACLALDKDQPDITPPIE